MIDLRDGRSVGADFSAWLISLMPPAGDAIFVFDKNTFSAGLPALEKERSLACLPRCRETFGLSGRKSPALAAGGSPGGRPEGRPP